MRMLDLFSGIGGFSLAASWVWGDDLNILSFCEIDPFCQKVLKKHWPDVPIHEDVRILDGKAFTSVDLIVGGFPCQPFSGAGRKKGETDERYLWPEMFRIVYESRPTWVIAENVVGIIRMVEFERMCADLETISYDFQALNIPACSVGAPHYRDRVWVVANSNSKRLEGIHDESYGKCVQLPENIRKEWETEPGLDRVALGIPNRVDRLKALGNAIVPQVAARIMMAIKFADEGLNNS